ncbi:MAG: prepilin-type N-terminal cleavage/methylation domain-containing protein [Verrucomicrobia bacterium]|nr:prepilin-type N-terminal cleavage/methylation domain-containing protein [Verrucomicrobiota bacterium]
MRRRGFTLIEVLVSLAIFALAAVSLGAAYSNVILGRIALQQDEQRLDDIARCRAALMETPGFDDVETGGDIHLPGGRTAHWKGKIEATAVSDLFAVELSCEIPTANGGEPEEISETRMLLRPTWSIPADRQKIRDDARQRLEKERGYKEADGNSAFISSPTRGKKLVPGQTGANGKGGKNGQGTPQNGKNGQPAQPAKGGQPGGQPAARPAKR